jgi:acid phosphatase type 7
VNGSNRNRRAATAAVLVALALVLVNGRGAGAAAPDVSGDTLVVVGDLVPGPGGNLDNAKAVRDLALRQDADAYVFAGDLQYEKGELANYRNIWAPIWGGVFNRSYPAPGNHEYGNGTNSGWAATGGGYFDYWGSRARPSAASYYSFNVNLPGGKHWHVVGAQLGLRPLRQPADLDHAQLRAGRGDGGLAPGRPGRRQRRL